MKRIHVLAILLYGSIVHATDIHECDRLAAHPSDPDRVGSGVSSADVDVEAAIRACRDAVREYPDEARFHYQLGRALTYHADRHGGSAAEGFDAVTIAADLDYTQALFVLGLLHVRQGDVCAAEPLTRQAADQGLKSARISYANAALAGEYASCGVSATDAEIAAYLDAARGQVSGYYENMLLSDLQRRLDYRAPITRQVWQEAVVSVTDIDRTARFFVEIGGYEEKWRGPMDESELRYWDLPAAASAEALLLGRPGEESGLLRLVRFDNAGRREPTRPGSRAWDTGCYFSLMVRMKDMQSVYDDAITLGWWTETPITDLAFGESRLKVIVFQGPDGVQVQAYERLSPPLPDAIPEFDRFTRPFNVMQMVRDRDASYDFFTQVLGFATFYKGKPYTSPQPTYMPLGIPKNLTTSIRYRAGIVYPVAGEFGRMETIEIMDLDGHDYADRCNAPHLGILAVRFPVDDIDRAESRIRQHEWPIDARAPALVVNPYGRLASFSVKTPDGANVQFYETMEAE